VADRISIVFGAVIALSLGVSAGAVLFGRSKKERPIEVALRDLSILWTKRDGREEVHISELAPLWKTEESQAEPSKEAPEFQNERITSFWRQQVKEAPWFQGASAQQGICTDILRILDREGSCPSVVNAAGDVEGSWDTNTFTLLSRVTLTDHTLNVADEMIHLLVEAGAQHVIPDGLIAALGHDLGKLESVRGYLYSLGEHPLTAGRVLAGVSGFKNLARKDEISRAIKFHHKMPEGLIGKLLKKADQAARQKELEMMVEQAVLADQTDPQEKKEGAPASERPQPAREEASTGRLSRPVGDSTAAWQAQADIYGEDTTPSKPKTEAPRQIDISSWFDAQAFLDELRPYINRMNGRRFMAFSMPDGYVYIQPKALEEVARRQAEKAGVMDIATMSNDDKAMRQVLFTIVHHLRDEHDVIARELIKDTYFGGYFSVTTKEGKVFKGYYTPFHAEAFGSLAAMEAKKPGMLRGFHTVRPYTDSQ